MKLTYNTRRLLNSNLYSRFILIVAFILMGLVSISEIYAESNQIQLSNAEKKWLSLNTTVRVRISNWPPFMFSDGEFSGISVDYIKKIFNHHGINYQFISGKQISWKAALSAIKDHQIVDLLPTSKITDERKEFMLFTDEYLFLPWVIFSRVDSPFIGGLRDLSGKTVCVPDGYVMHTLLAKNYPDIKLKVITGDNMAPRCIEALALGGVDAYVGNLAVGSYAIQSRGYTNLKIAAPTPFGTHNQAMALRNDWPELQSIINKSLRSMTPEEHSQIRNKWLSVQYEHGIQAKDVFKWILSVAGLLSVIILAILVWNRRLNKEIVIRQKIERKLKKSEETARALLDASTESAFLLDRNGRFLILNKVTADRLGIKPEDVIGMPASSYISKELFESRKQVIEKIISSKKPVRFIDERDGIILDHNIHPILDQHGEVDRLAVFSQDITERKRATQELAKWAHIFKLCRWGVAVGNIKNNTLDMVNPGLAEMHGWAVEELTHKPISTLYAPDSLKDLRENIKLANEKGHHTFESMHMRKDGSIFPAIVDVIAIKDDSGKLLYRAATIIDISERKTLEQERENLIAELQEALAEVKTLSSFLPICASCKKIRDDRGYWNQIEAYIHTHTGTRFSHSVCPECIDRLYPDLKK